MGTTLRINGLFIDATDHNLTTQRHRRVADGRPPPTLSDLVHGSPPTAGCEIVISGTYEMIEVQRARRPDLLRAFW